MNKNTLIQGDALQVLKRMEDESVQLIIADPPYFQVLEGEDWDNSWADGDSYLAWCKEWVIEAGRVLKKNGLFYIFGQLGKREHIWLHFCSQASNWMQYHDMVIWDRVVGYNDRKDSFTPCYEMALCLRRKDAENVYFNKDAVRDSYDQKTIEAYMKDNRYKDKEARRAHLEKGKYATNIFRVPSLKGNSKEKVGHPSQKPLKLIDKLVLSSSQEGDVVLDPFCGSGSSLVTAQLHERKWIGIEMNSEYIGITRSRLDENSFFGSNYDFVQRG